MSSKEFLTNQDKIKVVISDPDSYKNIKQANKELKGIIKEGNKRLKSDLKKLDKIVRELPIEKEDNSKDKNIGDNKNPNQSFEGDLRLRTIKEDDIKMGMEEIEKALK